MTKRTSQRIGLLFALLVCVMLFALSGSAFADGDPTYSYDADTHTLTLTGGDFDKDHKWGDDLTKNSIYHVTAQTGVRFVGDCRELFKNFSYCTDMDLRNVDVSGMTYAWQIFTGAQYSLTSLNVAGWNVSSLTDMNCMFGYLSKLTTLNLSSWDVSGVTGMEAMFNGCSRLTTLNTTGWDVSHVTTMRNMFASCSSLTDLDLSRWDVSGVTDMYNMFYQCTSLRNLNVANWDVSGVTNMYCMFQNCSSLTALDVANWDVSSVLYMDGMFRSCSGLTSLDLSGWDTAALGGTGYLFMGCSGLTELDLRGWNLYNINPYYALEMFDDMPKLCRLTLPPVREGSTQYPDQPNWYLNNGANGEGWVVEGTTEVISGAGKYAVIPAPAEVTTFVWNPAGPPFSYDEDTEALTLNYGDYDKDSAWGSVPTASVRSVTANSGVRFVGDCSGLFYNFNSCQSMDLSLADTSEMTGAKGFFAKCGSLETLNIAAWDTAAVTDMSFMFQDCDSLENMDLSAWDTAAVTDMSFMFDGCKSLPTLSITNWDTHSVTDMSSMFRDCYDLEALEIAGWNTAAVTDMNHMFYSCITLTSLNLTGWWDTSGVTDMSYMFADCYDLASLTISGWNTEAVADMEGMFKECLTLETLDLTNITVGQNTETKDMFLSATPYELTLWSGFDIRANMCLSNDYNGGWIVKGDETQTVISGEGEYAVIAAPARITVFAWRFPPCSHPNAVTAFDDKGHWLYCPDCEKGIADTYEEHFEHWQDNKYVDIETVRVTVPGMEQTAELPANIRMGTDSTVQFLGENKTFTYLPDNSGVISCKDDESESWYIPGGFEASHKDPPPALPDVYSVMIPGADMEMRVKYEDCGYGILDMFVGHGPMSKIWADKWFVTPGELVTFGVSPMAGYRCSVTVKSGNTVISYSPGNHDGEFTFTMPTGNVTMEISAEELPALVLPAGTLSIMDSAFENCGAYVVKLPAGCTSIGANAFKDCANLEAIYIPVSVTTIDETAFDGCGTVCVYGEAESTAQDYAYRHNNMYFWDVAELG